MAGAEVSTSDPPAKREGEVKTQEAKPDAPVSYLRLYSQADTIDRVAIALGLLGAILNAPTMPLFAYVFGEVRSSFNDHPSAP